MTCYNPLVRLEHIGEFDGLTKDGRTKRKITIISLEDFERDEAYYKSKYLRCSQIPCGKCVGCRLDYSRQWANRLMLEAKNYPTEQCWFVTLTYRDEELTWGKEVPDPETGEAIRRPVLNKKDMQDFFKRLRAYYEYHYKEDGIRYYYCGEYGDQTGRPHYHAIIFGMNIHTKMKEYKKNFGNQILWEWDECSTKIWKKGYVVTGAVTWESAAYVARYVMKKRKGKDSKEYYEKAGLVPEFVDMSRRPGIGRNYYDEHREEIYETDSIYVPTKSGLRECKPPRYFDCLEQIHHEQEFKELKRKRIWKGEYQQRLKDERTDLSREEQRKAAEERKKTSIKMLVRKEI